MNKQSSIKVTTLDGDLSVGRKMTMGGDFLTQGNAHIKRNLRVDGYIEANNFKGPNKGLFTSLEILQDTYPYPENGWWALIGDNLPASLYIVVSGEWQDSGFIVGDGLEIDLNSVNLRIDDIEELVSAIESDILPFSHKYNDSSGFNVIDDTAPGPIGQICYFNNENSFYYCIKDAAYKQWHNRELYMKDNCPRGDKLFSMHEKLYYYNGSNIISLSTGGGIDMAQEKGSNTDITMSQDAISREFDNLEELIRFKAFPIFEGIIDIQDDDIIEQTILSTEGKVFFNENSKAFVYKVGLKYYVSWSNVYDYNHITNGKLEAIPNKIFICNDRLCFWNGSKIIVIENDRQQTNVVYSELVALRDSAKLVPGTAYRITDYVTKANTHTSTWEDTDKGVIVSSAEHPFDIIVTALSNDTLSEDAKAILHEGDIYFASAGIESWEIKYCIDNNYNRPGFLYYDENSKGVIYYMKDALGNEAPYDFKNIQFTFSTRYQYDLLESMMLGIPYYTFSVLLSHWTSVGDGVNNGYIIDDEYHIADSSLSAKSTISGMYLKGDGSVGNITIAATQNNVVKNGCVVCFSHIDRDAGISIQPGNSNILETKRLIIQQCTRCHIHTPGTYSNLSDRIIKMDSSGKEASFNIADVATTEYVESRVSTKETKKKLVEQNVTSTDLIYIGAEDRYIFNILANASFSLVSVPKGNNPSYEFTLLMGNTAYEVRIRYTSSITWIKDLEIQPNTRYDIVVDNGIAMFVSTPNE